MNQDIHEYLAELDDIPGTRVFTAARARKGYWINQFAMSLMKADNRARFKADEEAYLDEWKLSDEPRQRPAVSPWASTLPSSTSPSASSHRSSDWSAMSRGSARSS